MRYFIELAFNGRNYHGWQRQPNAISLQEELESQMCKLFGYALPLVGAGRTDAGVHARQMMAHFEVNQAVETEVLVYKLNRMLPSDIYIKQIFRVRSDAHARFDAIWREYEYNILLEKDPFLWDFGYYFPRILKVDLMNEACEILKGRKDFQCFSKVKTDVKTFNCNLMEAFWEKREGKLVFRVKSNRFLRNMVRAIVGTLISVGRERISLIDLRAILESKRRSNAGESVPAKGLFLNRIAYPTTIKQF